MSPRRRWVLAGAGVVLLAVLVHSPSLTSGFALDDVRDIQWRAWVSTGRGAGLGTSPDVRSL
ncbi:MAG: hypothetical protein GWM92_16735 [Gemmatimonadetes bacterium]|nr:hypothetical protein [Gemmatimonadota bacterium]NIR80416.1 hypothetical protein [Gemmatimonadota bacterium]NIT89176.1 hypothetical protein [Gemmatimonadota bacterium]NIU32976.1 hypothetical protein [Gemmatimonadota bacterium]NIU37363.1 hypothetical protein [Gemmatimonadota bacterium]